MSDSEDSNYIVEEYVRPDKIGAPPVNDESADILGNFDDKKRKNIENNVLEEDSFMESNSEEDSDDSDDDEEQLSEQMDSTANPTDNPLIAEKEQKKAARAKLAKMMQEEEDRNGRIGQEQITSLLQGVSKANRFVLYVTNLNFTTSKERLAEYFSQAGGVKAVRIPKKRRGGFAFIEMVDINAFQVR